VDVCRCRPATPNPRQPASMKPAARTQGSPAMAASPHRMRRTVSMCCLIFASYSSGTGCERPP
jgi:hypothetical protein